MILVQAIRIDAYDRHQYRIEATGHTPIVTSEPDEAAEILTDLGVPKADVFVAHAKTWGAVEIVETTDAKH